MWAEMALFVLAQGVLQQPKILGAAPAPILRQVGIDQKMGALAPLDLEFRNEAGQTVRLGEYFRGRAVILAPVYYSCPMLCHEILRGLAGSLRAVGFTAGQEFEVVAFSFDPKDSPETAAEKKRALGTRAEKWHLLTGDPDAIRDLTEAIGYRYAYDEKAQQFAHGAAILVLTREGRVSRYLYGVEYAPRDLRLGLIEASEGRIGRAIDQFLLFCYHYDPSTGKYTNAVLGMLRILAGVTVAALGTFLIAMFRRERRA
jgi:protein SCO1/2